MMSAEIPDEYQTDDFGFTAVDSIESSPVEVPVVPDDLMDRLQYIVDRLDVIETYVKDNPKLSKDEVDSRLQSVEKMIMPLLLNLMKNPEKDYILWPKRKEQVEAFIQKLLKLTRGDNE